MYGTLNMHPAHQPMKLQENSLKGDKNNILLVFGHRVEAFHLYISQCQEIFLVSLCIPKDRQRHLHSIYDPNTILQVQN